MNRIKQFVPEEVCLACKGCCRFSQQDSVWSPCLLDEEIQELLDNNALPGAYLSKEHKLLLVENKKEGNFICPFLDSCRNACKIYSCRPFECQLYPFLINLRDKKVILTIDLNCPYASKKMDSPRMKEYIAYLTELLNSPEQVRMLKDNPQIIQAYEEVAEIIELKLPHETP